MHSLVVLCDHPRWNSYYSIVFPLYKWKKLIRNHGINMIITTDKHSEELKNADTAIIISRVFADGWQSIKARNDRNEAEMIEYLIALKKTVKKLIWYDRSDPSGTTDFPIINYVDVFLKNQTFKDLNLYTQDNGAKSIRPWLTDTTHLEAHFHKYVPCPPDQLHKITLGWNIVHSDQRVFRFDGKERLISNYIFCKPKMYAPSINRPLDFSLRGALDYGGSNAAISDQRNTAIHILNKLTKYKSVLSGERIDKAGFMKELSESKVCVSPFGWGEVCYRDFEIFIAGALMIKPSLNHLNTYPNIYIDNETFIPVNWEMDDLAEKMTSVLDNYPKYIDIAKNGHDAFLNAITDGEGFVQHLISII